MADYTNINSQAETCYRMLMNQYRGNYAKVLARLRDDLSYEPSNRVLTEAIYICKSRNGFID